MKRGAPLERRTQLKADPEKVREFQQRARANSRPKLRAVSLASPAQREAVKGRPCLVCGEYGADPAHLIPRSLLSEGQDDSRAVVPLDRPCHRAYDDGTLDLLPYLEPDWRIELAFAVLKFGLVSTIEKDTYVDPRGRRSCRLCRRDRDQRNYTKAA